MRIAQRREGVASYQAQREASSWCRSLVRLLSCCGRSSVMSRMEGVGKVRRSEGDVAGGEGGAGAIFYYFPFFRGGEGIGRVVEMEMEEEEDEMEEEMELWRDRSWAEADTAAKTGTSACGPLSSYPRSSHH